MTVTRMGKSSRHYHESDENGHSYKKRRYEKVDDYYEDNYGPKRYLDAFSWEKNSSYR